MTDGGGASEPRSLRIFAGTWQGDQGKDLAPSITDGQRKTPFREQMVWAPFKPVVNWSQTLYALRYRTTAWPLNDSNPVHEKVGYWL